MATGERRDPFRSFNFQLEIDGIPRGAFSECSGLTADGDAVDYREGTDMQPNMRKLPGLRKYPNVTLKRGVTQDTSLWSWYQNIANGVSDRRNVTIILLNEERQPVLSFNLYDAFLNKYDASPLNAGRSEVAIESVELVHEGLTIE
jgi:phage tail-like protein